jgi:hypothetical protein
MRMLETQERVALLIDLENLLVPSRKMFTPGEVAYALNNLLAEFRVVIRRSGLTLVKKFSCLYLERQLCCSEEWHAVCARQARLHHFNLYWSRPRQPAETLLVNDVDLWLKSCRSSFPQLTILASGDGHVSPAARLIRMSSLPESESHREVCTVAYNRQMSGALREIVDGFIDLDDLLPNTVQALFG